MLETTVTTIVHQEVVEGPDKAKDVCRVIGKPYSTLMRELNPFDSGAKLGAETLMSIMRVTRNVEPLRWMARQLGYSLVPLDKAGARPAYLSGSKGYSARNEERV